MKNIKERKKKNRKTAKKFSKVKKELHGRQWLKKSRKNSPKKSQKK
jgi:hypothetical protein